LLCLSYVGEGAETGEVRTVVVVRRLALLLESGDCRGDCTRLGLARSRFTTVCTCRGGEAPDTHSDTFLTAVWLT
jgi:hypothetical protein